MPLERDLIEKSLDNAVQQDCEEKLIWQSSQLQSTDATLNALLATAESTAQTYIDALQAALTYVQGSTNTEF